MRSITSSFRNGNMVRHLSDFGPAPIEGVCPRSSGRILNPQYAPRVFVSRILNYEEPVGVAMFASMIELSVSHGCRPRLQRSCHRLHLDPTANVALVVELD